MQVLFGKQDGRWIGHSDQVKKIVFPVRGTENKLRTGTWDCQVVKDTQPDNPRRGALIVRPVNQVTEYLVVEDKDAVKVVCKEVTTGKETEVLYTGFCHELTEKRRQLEKQVKERLQKELAGIPWPKGFGPDVAKDGYSFRLVWRFDTFTIIAQWMARGPTGKDYFGQYGHWPTGAGIPPDCMEALLACGKEVTVERLPRNAGGQVIVRVEGTYYPLAKETVRRYREFLGWDAGTGTAHCRLFGHDVQITGFKMVTYETEVETGYLVEGDPCVYTHTELAGWEWLPDELVKSLK